MKANALIAAALACICLQGCYKDKGNNDYKVSGFPALTVTVSDAALTAYMGEEFSYTPTVTSDKPGGVDDFEYWWELTSRNKKSAESRQVVSQGLQLNYMPQGRGEQTVQLCVREKSTGRISYHSIKLQVYTNIEKGWLVLSKGASGNSMLSFVQPGYDASQKRVYRAYPDVYASSYPNDPLGSNPIAIRQCLTGKSVEGSPMSAVYVIQDETVCLDGASYEKVIKMEDEFVGGTPAGFQPVDYYQNTYTGLVLDKSGKVYVRYIDGGGQGAVMFTDRFPGMPMSYNGEQIKADRIIPSNFIVTTAVYEKEKNRILFIKGANQKGGDVLVRTVSGVTFTADMLDVADMTGVELVYSGSWSEQQIAAWYIMLYRKNSKYFAQTFKATTTASSLNFRYDMPVTCVEFPDPSLITPDTKYYNTRNWNRTGPLFIAAGNKIHMYDLAKMAAAPALYYTLPEGESVVDMSSNPQESELGVVTKDASGKSYFYTFNIVVPVQTQSTCIYRTEIPGTAVDLEYKYSNYIGYQVRTGNGD